MLSVTNGNTCLRCQGTARERISKTYNPEFVCSDCRCGDCQIIFGIDCSCGEIHGIRSDQDRLVCTDCITARERVAATCGPEELKLRTQWFGEEEDL